MQLREYAVVDVETTGSALGGNRITEICIVRLNQEGILEKYTTLVDPEQLIPDFITSLTGIDNALVASAPLFTEIASEIIRMTEDAVFVAHNVSFDYNVIRNEFKRLGKDFTRKKLCTVRLSRELIPGLPSYSLGRLCDAVGISLSNRHRAEGDTDATVTLFQQLLNIDEDGNVIDKFLNGSKKEGTFPPNLDRTQFDSLPESPGVYLFKDGSHKVIYVGKAINLKKRVLSHFYTKRSKTYLMCQEIRHIEHIETGNELVALLEEADLIKHYYPKFNSAQKQPRNAYQVLYYKNQLGIIQLAVGLSKSYDSTLSVHYNRAHAVEELEEICMEFDLCPRFCGLQTNVTTCSHFKIKNCKGVCRKEESVSLYNIRVNQAIESLRTNRKNYLIKQAGRSTMEDCFILIKDGDYHGYGFISKEETIETLEDAETFLERKKPNYHTNQIIKSHLRTHGNRHVIMANAFETDV
ncbi:MAG: exonuclease domain-containing protein [Nonlabens sp.]|nr:exonuclease domain-containing protein [Nonlabens sp.]